MMDSDYGVDSFHTNNFLFIKNILKSDFSIPPEIQLIQYAIFILFFAFLVIFPIYLLIKRKIFTKEDYLLLYFAPIMLIPSILISTLFLGQRINWPNFCDFVIKNKALYGIENIVSLSDKLGITNKEVAYKIADKIVNDESAFRAYKAYVYIYLSRVGEVCEPRYQYDVFEKYNYFRFDALPLMNSPIDYKFTPFLVYCADYIPSIYALRWPGVLNKASYYFKYYFPWPWVSNGLFTAILWSFVLWYCIIFALRPLIYGKSAVNYRFIAEHIKIFIESIWHKKYRNALIFICFLFFLFLFKAVTNQIKKDSYNSAYQDGILFNECDLVFLGHIEKIMYSELGLIRDRKTTIDIEFEDIVSNVKDAISNPGKFSSFFEGKLLCNRIIAFSDKIMSKVDKKIYDPKEVFFTCKKHDYILKNKEHNITIYIFRGTLLLVISLIFYEVYLFFLKKILS